MRKVAAPIGLDLPGKCAAAGPEGSENALTRRLRDLTGLQKTHAHHRGGLTNPNYPLARPNKWRSEVGLRRLRSASAGEEDFHSPPLLYHHRTTGSKTHPDSWIPLYHHAQPSPFKLRAIIARRVGRSAGEQVAGCVSSPRFAPPTSSSGPPV